MNTYQAKVDNLISFANSLGEQFNFSIYQGIATATTTKDEELTGWWESEVHDDTEINEFLDSIAESMEVDIPEEVLQFIEKL